MTDLKCEGRIVAQNEFEIQISCTNRNCCMGWGGWMGRVGMNAEDEHELHRRIVEAITADDWIRYEWVEVTGPSDSQRMFVQGKIRTPDESAKAKADVEAIGWDAWREQHR